MTLDNGAEVIIGFEVHVELATASKLFCPCDTTFGAPPNTHVCPVCLGYPGVLPELNRQAVRLAVRAGLGLDCRINETSRFDRKNYFYPDLPKGYQITQFHQPIAEWGHIDIADGGDDKRIVIRRIHIEEEAGKLNHEGETLWSSTASLVDYNRAGIPLIEIVSEPDLRSPDEARAYLNQLRTILSYLDVSDLRMEEGSMRFDANISLRPPGFSGSLEDLPRVEVKNINSIRNAVRALEFEIGRQAELLDAEERVPRETRGFDERTGRTVSQRSKEQSDDYRYFPEPDLPPLILTGAWIQDQEKTLPLLPDQLKTKLETDGLTAQEAETITSLPATVAYYDAARGAGAPVRPLVTWMLGDLARLWNEHHTMPEASPVSPEGLAELLQLIESGTLSGRMAKEVLEAMYDERRSAKEIVAARGLTQIQDPSVLREHAERVVRENPKVAEEVRQGKDRALAFLVGQVMKATRGQAKPDLVNQLLREVLAGDDAAT